AESTQHPHTQRAFLLELMANLFQTLTHQDSLYGLTLGHVQYLALLSQTLSPLHGHLYQLTSIHQLIHPLIILNGLMKQPVTFQWLTELQVTLLNRYTTHYAIQPNHKLFLQNNRVL